MPVDRRKEPAHEGNHRTTAAIPDAILARLYRRGSQIRSRVEKAAIAKLWLFHARRFRRLATREREAISRETYKGLHRRLCQIESAVASHPKPGEPLLSSVEALRLHLECRRPLGRRPANPATVEAADMAMSLQADFGVSTMSSIYVASGCSKLYGVGVTTEAVRQELRRRGRRSAG